MSEKIRYGFYSGCCFQGADARFFDILREVFAKVDVELDLIEDAVCCGSGVIEERSELTSLAVNAKNMAHAEQMGLPLYTPCSTCYNVISNAQKRMKEDPAVHAQVNEILAEQGLEYKGTCKLTHTLWVFAQDVGLDKLKERVTNPLTGLRVASYYGCHTRNPADIQGYESADNPTSLEDILEVLGVEIVEYDTKDDCCGYHLAWPNNDLNMKMTSNVLEGAHTKDVDLMVTSCPLCFKSMDGTQAKALAQTGKNFQLPVLFLPELVGLACGMTSEDMMLKYHGVPVNLRL
ncbi:MAG: CoB--CoM heterodisulfide reductase iron-sulfur subunit B family protein [gamma proteobacterium endosymbiont of Lamellibrachia anaximandri]|nr:CoB--CoM heterodisulfide reductase iron-sulfur subunit B family protein [gamma proteobacterium endosymbiont of Lamellibrachia anaximandri]MBL3533093.1 CoB--CoM heterodisulfide reductase iron-sulfur subunit B family protein [gamma proteobacterium endosymbiont of Lamellibrachia anaximandri]MBL3600346.1 CoB--CoM heterodisulfide reductase iron-sulfur subunit B family protein [gamma proteobacterium endosymbiont of Lamellibrachia anaximandri]